MAIYAYACRNIDTCKDAGPNCSYRTTRDLGPTVEEECEGIGLVTFEGGLVTPVRSGVPRMTKYVEIKASGNSLIVTLQKFGEMDLRLYDEVTVQLMPYVDDGKTDPLNDLGLAIYLEHQSLMRSVGEGAMVVTAKRKVRSYSGMLGVSVTGLCRKLDLGKGRMVIATITKRPSSNSLEIDDDNAMDEDC